MAEQRVTDTIELNSPSIERRKLPVTHLEWTAGDPITTSLVIPYFFGLTKIQSIVTSNAPVKRART
jgi:hypothetical protein